MMHYISPIGFGLIAVAFIAAAVAATAYFLYYRDRQPALMDLANRSFVVMAISSGLALAFLVFLIMTHDFRVNYVYSYSSTILSKYLLFASLWAGQEGTFLMWTFYGAIYGFILMRTVGRERPLVLGFLVLVEAVLLLILLKKNPFAMIWHIHEEAPIGFMPRDGAGLNPLLQNGWMVIHPPTLFLGYSSTVVAFVFALSAMITRDYHGWIKAVRPWVIFNVLVLGTGIILGGYWAYTTLGWGGYWGWDPVENASLVPWLFSLALLHGILIQNKRKALVRTNLFLAGGAFLTMVWGSFLTRSGVLTDFSVHSFAPSGLSFYLIMFQVLFTGLFFFLFFRMLYQQYRAGEAFTAFDGGVLNRETFILAGMLILILTGLMVLLGTSAPLYTPLFGEAASLSPDFYNTLITPIGIAMLIVIAIAPLLAWKTSELRNIPTIMGSAGAAAVLTVVAVVLGLRNFMSIVLVFLSAFVVFINGKVAFLFIKRNLPAAGGYLAHIGVGFMVIGIITSSLYDRSEKVMLPQGKFAPTGLGYEIQFVDFVNEPDGRDRVKLVVKTPGGTYEAYPRFFYSDYTNGYMVSPDVRVAFARDIYISPISYTPAELSNLQRVELGKGETRAVGDLKITFHDFEVQMGAASQKVAARLTVQVMENGYPRDIEVQPTLVASQGQMHGEEVEIPGTPYRIKIGRVNATTKKVELHITMPSQDGDTPRNMLAVEVSEKPLISILWFGCLVFMLGGALTLVNRIKQRR